MFREHFVMPQRQCVPLPAGALPDVSLGEIAMSEPVSVALHPANRAGPLMGRRVLITGSGTIGCLMVLAERLAGAAIASRRVEVRPVLSGEHPLTQAAQAITLARDKTKSMTVQLVAG